MPNLAWAARAVAQPALDFERPRRNNGWPGALLLIAGMLACGWVGARAVALQHDVERLEALPPAARVATPRAITRTAAANTTRQNAQQANQASEVVARLAMPWGKWFRQLETSAKGKVVFTALQPQADGHRVRIAGEARRFDDLVDYMVALEATPGFANVFLSEHAEAAGGISFTLEADWLDAP